jgi:hypothetical protein
METPSVFSIIAQASSGFNGFYTEHYFRSRFPRPLRDRKHCCDNNLTVLFYAHGHCLDLKAKGMDRVSIISRRDFKRASKNDDMEIPGKAVLNRTS